MRLRAGKREFNVKWKVRVLPTLPLIKQGYSSKDNTWETEANISENCEGQIKAFLKSEKKSAKEKTSSKGVKRGASEDVDDENTQSNKPAKKVKKGTRKHFIVLVIVKAFIPTARKSRRNVDVADVQDEGI
jgi:hypothetical protein